MRSPLGEDIVLFQLHTLDEESAKFYGWVYDSLDRPQSITLVVPKIMWINNNPTKLYVDLKGL